MQQDLTAGDTDLHLLYSRSTGILLGSLQGSLRLPSACNLQAASPALPGNQSQALAHPAEQRVCLSAPWTASECD